MSFTVTVTQQIDPNKIVNLLATAFDGPCVADWAHAETNMPDDPDWSWCEDKSEWDNVRKCYVASMCGGDVILIDHEDETERHTLDKASLERGIQVMADKYPKHFSNFMNENDDAETGDIFVQCCLFGKIVYG